MDVEQIIFEMLTECTGAAMCDSGGAYGRNWERNKDKDISAFKNQPEVWYETDEDGNLECYTISVFHYLTKQLEIDVICQEFNQVNQNAENWDSDIAHGVSAEAEKILDKYNVQVQDGFNSYNHEDFLSQVIQGSYCQIAGNGYVILQIHGGCDVRGGYTNARLFRIANDYGDVLALQDVYGTFTPNGTDLETLVLPGVDMSIEECTGVVQFDNCYDGYNLTNDGTEVELNEDKGKIELYLCIC